MRSSPILATVLAFIFSEFPVAASHNKRFTMSASQICIASLTDANEQLLILKTIARNQYVSFQAFNLNEPRLESALKTASTDCCAAAIIPDGEVNAVIDTFATTTTKITDLFDVFLAKESPKFPAASATSRIKNSIRSLADIVGTLNVCLISATPDSHHSDVQGYISIINDKVAATLRTYGMGA